MKQETSIFQRLRQSLDLPAELGAGQSQMMLNGNRELTIYGHSGIVAYARHEIQVRVRGGLAVICGAELEIARMNPARLVICGQIDALQLERGL